MTGSDVRVSGLPQSEGTAVMTATSRPRRTAARTPKHLSWRPQQETSCVDTPLSRRRTTKREGSRQPTVISPPPLRGPRPLPGTPTRDLQRACGCATASARRPELHELSLGGDTHTQATATTRNSGAPSWRSPPQTPTPRPQGRAKHRGPGVRAARPWGAPGGTQPPRTPAARARQIEKQQTKKTQQVLPRPTTPQSSGVCLVVGWIKGGLSTCPRRRPRSAGTAGARWPPARRSGRGRRRCALTPRGR